MGLPKPTVQLLLKENQDHACAEAPEICVKVMAIAELPDMFGEFQVVAFWNNFDRKEHAALIHGDIFEKEDVPVRLHSECLTGDTLGSLRCDCREQLQESMRQIAKMDRGIVLYMRQEGRGIGFINKIKAYQLQDEGYDTFRANEVLGFKRDERDYDLAAHMLRALHVNSIKLRKNKETPTTQSLDVTNHRYRIRYQPRNVKSSCSSRHKTCLWAGFISNQRSGGHFWQRPSQKNSSTVKGATRQSSFRTSRIILSGDHDSVRVHPGVLSLHYLRSPSAAHRRARYCR